jgi:hypothetical protein
MWVSAEESHRKGSNCMEFAIKTFCTYPRVTEEIVAEICGSQWVKSWISMGHGRDSRRCLEKCARIDCTTGQPLPS